MNNQYSSGSQEWQAITDENGTTYYYNTITGEAQWEKPASLMKPRHSFST